MKEFMSISDYADKNGIKTTGKQRIMLGYKARRESKYFGYEIKGKSPKEYHPTILRLLFEDRN